MPLLTFVVYELNAAVCGLAGVMAYRARVSSRGAMVRRRRPPLEPKALSGSFAFGSGLHTVLIVHHYEYITK